VIRYARATLVLLLPLFLACGQGEAPADEHDHGHEAEAPTQEDEATPGAEAAASHMEEHFAPLHVEPALAEAWELEVGPPGRTDIASEVELPGVLTTNENRTARIGVLVAGEVAEILTDLGDRVQAGQALAALNSPEFTQAQSSFLQAYARAALSQRDYERALALREQQAIEEREYLRRQALVEQDLADLRGAEVLLHSLGVDEETLTHIINVGLDTSRPLQDHSAVEPYMAIRSPVRGVVLTRDAILGNHVEPGQVLFTVSDLSNLWARLDAYEHQIPALSTVAEVMIRVPLIPDRVFPGRVTYVADQVDEELRTVRVRVEVPNADGILKPNMYVQGFLRVRTQGQERFVVPADAVQTLEGHTVVFVEAPPEPGEEHRVFSVVEVHPGATITAGTIILEGLEGTERIVTRGAFTLKAEMTKGAAGHGHEH
jgi:cobalt-zinc-cadmium efflux system membrane fusion protein